jgi:hypothetical protein
MLGRVAKHWPQFAQLKPRSHAILKKVLCGDNGIDARHLALDPLSEVFEHDARRVASPLRQTRARARRRSRATRA